MNSKDTILWYLKQFELDDLRCNVFDLRKINAEEIDYSQEMPLSVICGDRDLKRRLFSDGPVFDLGVVHNGTKIGVLDSDYVFGFDKSPDISTALGWGYATDIAGKLYINRPDLDSISKRLSNVVKNYGTGKDIFFGSWSSLVQSLFKYGVTSHFGDGANTHKIYLWKVATRVELGEEHEGYVFAC